MREGHLKYLICPACQGRLMIAEAHELHDGEIKEGVLQCGSCGKTYDIIRHIPRFVPMSNYADGFGLEWTKHARTQYDAYSGRNISRARFFKQTRWPVRLDGECILEVGGGAGRFTEPAAATGAMVVSMDLSYAVDANYASNGGKDNVLIVQADIYAMPFREASFDKLFCFGVLQHTPTPEQAFQQLPRYLKSGGRLAIDVYRRWHLLKQMTVTKYWVRPLTKHLPPELLYRYSKRYVEWMWPVARLLRKIPFIGRPLILRLLVADYQSSYDLSDEILKEWAILDTFDMLSPAYDYPQARETVDAWFGRSGLSDVELQNDAALVVGRGTKP